VNKENVDICGKCFRRDGSSPGRIKIGKLIGKFSYFCTQEDEYGMYSSFVLRKFKVVSLSGGRYPRM